MENTINDILLILDYIIYRNDNDVYKRYLNKEYNYNIEYISPIKITLIPKVLFVLTDNIKENYNDKILMFYITLLYKIHSTNINKLRICTIDHTNMATVKHYKHEKRVSIIRGNTLNLSNGTDFEIWIYTDQCTKNGNENIQYVDSIDSISNIVSYRIIIAHSKKISSKLFDNLSIKIFLKD
jgi:hypothetical protein